MSETNIRPISELIGKTLKSVIMEKDKSSIVFTTADGEDYLMMHNQDCCERVRVEDIDGELDWLVGSPILRAEENTSKSDPPGWRGFHADNSFTWTFYRFETAKGGVVIRWVGDSNGYYSERVDFVKVI